MFKFTVLFLINLAACFSFGFAQIPASAYVVNSVGESLSMINLENHTVTLNAEPLGLYTNQVVLRNEKAYVVNSGPNEIQVIDLAALNTVGNIDVGAGTSPWGMAFVDDQIAAVSLLNTGQVKFVNVTSGQVVQTANVGTGPQGVVFSDGKVYVANTGFNGGGYDPGTVSVIDANNYSVNTISVALNPWMLALDSQGNIAVACAGDYGSVGGEINVIDPAAQQVVHSTPAGIPVTGVAVSAGNKAYFSTFASGVLVYNLSTLSFERDASNPLPGGPGLAFDAQDNVYITDFALDSVYVYSPAHERVNEYLVGDGPVSIAIYDPAPNSIDWQINQLAQGFALSQNYPNPFNPQTTIRFETFKNGEVLLEVYNILGEKILALVHDYLPAGVHVVEWNGKNSVGENVPSGIYFYRLQMGSETSVRKMHLLQ